MRGAWCVMHVVIVALACACEASRPASPGGVWLMDHAFSSDRELVLTEIAPGRYRASLGCKGAPHLGTAAWDGVDRWTVELDANERPPRRLHLTCASDGATRARCTGDLTDGSGVAILRRL